VTGDVHEEIDVNHHPRHIDGFKVVHRLVHEQDFGEREHDAHKGELHPQPAAQHGDGGVGLCPAIGDKSDHCEHLLDNLPANFEVLNVFMNEHILDARHVALLSLDVNHDKDCPDCSAAGGILDVVVGDGPNEGRLTRTITTQ